MSSTILKDILTKIREYDRILLFRHIRMDGDCVGATMGLRGILRLTFPEKDVRIIDEQTSDFLSFVGPADEPIPDEAYRDALGIVLDTSVRSRISNPKYALCRELIKIDHHIETDPYGNLNWVEEGRSSACEMVARFYEAFSDFLRIDARAAAYVFLGMVTDSGRFRFSGVGGDTMRLAGLMLDQGVDTETLFAHLYLQDFDGLKFKAYVYEHIERTENGVAYIDVDRAARARFGLSFEAASNAVSYLENLRGCLCWMAFIAPDDPAEGVRVRIRSRFLPVNAVAESHHGGGHANACGATVYSPEEKQALIAQADALVRDYKANHTGWM